MNAGECVRVSVGGVRAQCVGVPFYVITHRIHQKKEPSNQVHLWRLTDFNGGGGTPRGGRPEPVEPEISTQKHILKMMQIR